ncbi:MAG TPA: DUF6683 family protein [Burkholderiaceae bacterium]|nr:DUF6683 family protein [Burkholderiaceae bacterium]
MLLRAQLSQDDEPLRVVPAPMPIAPTRMAAAQSNDTATRAELQALYTRCLQTYRDAAHSEGGEHEDAGAAMALFVAANLSALNDVEVTPTLLDVLERQLRGLTRRSADWDAAPPEKRQYFFERTAILGVLITGHHGNAKTQGAAALADVRRIARGYLEQLLGFDPRRLTIGPAGLTLRSR